MGLSRFAALVAAVVATVCLLTGCGAGQEAQTARMVPPVAGVEANSRPHGQAGLRNVQIQYNDPQGYPAGATAPLSLYIANNAPLKPLVLRDVTAARTNGGGQLGGVVLVGASGEPSEPATPPASAAAAAAPAALTIPPNGHVRLSPDAGTYLAITRITQPLRPGSSATVTFTFAGEEPLVLTVPFGMPLSPPPAAPAVPSVTAGG